MRSKAKELHDSAIVVNGHDHMVREILARRKRGDRAVFSSYFAPRFREGGVNVIKMVVGGDNAALADTSDLLLWGALLYIDTLWQEAEESADTMSICLNTSDVYAALAQGRVGILMTMEGGRPLEGRPNYDTLSTLRNLYRLGLRGLQLVDNGRNKLCDGIGETRTNGGLTRFGVEVVQELNRLGMVIDVAHMADAGFWDVLETSEHPILDSHSNARAICSHPRNLTDERIKAMAEVGGVIGLSFDSVLVNQDAEKPSIEDLMRHVNHIVELVGIDHVGLGPDHTEFELSKDHRASSPVLGSIEGVSYGGPKELYHLADAWNITQLPRVTEVMLKHGYSNEDVRKVLGENLLRLYRRVLG